MTQTAEWTEPEYKKGDKVRVKTSWYDEIDGLEGEVTDTVAGGAFLFVEVPEKPAGKSRFSNNVGYPLTADEVEPL